MSYETILFSVDAGIARLTLNRPDRLNSFTVQMHEEIKHAFDNAMDGARVLVITGAGRGFCAGQDLSDRAVAPDAAKTPDLGESLESRYNPLVRRITSLELPVICAVNGVAAGAGANMAFAADIVIAAKSAKFIQSFANIGLIPDSGGTWSLPRLAGLPRAMGLALTGEPLTAEKAEAWGLIWKCVEDFELGATTDAMAAKFASAPTKGLAATKKLLRESSEYSLNEQLELERDWQRTLGRTNDYREGVASFLEKRAPKFTGN